MARLFRQRVERLRKGARETQHRQTLARNKFCKVLEPPAWLQYPLANIAKYNDEHGRDVEQIHCRVYQIMFLLSLFLENNKSRRRTNIIIFQ